MKFWQKIKFPDIKLSNFKGLICEKGSNDISLGRVTFWILLTISVHFWYTRPFNEFPMTLTEAFMYTLAYNLFKKGINVVSASADTYFEKRSYSSSYKGYNQNLNNETDLSEYDIKDYK